MRAQRIAVFVGAGAPPSAAKKILLPVHQKQGGKSQLWRPKTFNAVRYTISRQQYSLAGVAVPKLRRSKHAAAKKLKNLFTKVAAILAYAAEHS